MEDPASAEQLHPVLETQKSQKLRIVDVFILAPFMLYLGIKPGNLSLLNRGTLIVLAGMIAAYNWKNYQINQKRLTE